MAKKWERQRPRLNFVLFLGKKWSVNVFFVLYWSSVFRALDTNFEKFSLHFLHGPLQIF